MAEDKLSKNIIEAVKQIKANIGSQNVQMPGGDKSQEEIQYSTTDLILGIAAVGMFGPNYKKTNSKNINSVLNQKSFLENISTNINKFTNTLTNSKKSIKVSVVNTPIVNLTSKSIEALKDVINPEAKNSETIGKIILSIENSSNFNELVESLENLTKLTKDDILSESVENLVTNVGRINSLPKLNQFNIDGNLIPSIKSFITYISSFINTINKNPIKKLNNASINNLELLNRFNKLVFDDNFKNKFENTIENLKNVFEIINKNPLPKLNDQVFVSINERDISNYFTDLQNLCETLTTEKDGKSILSKLEKLNEKNGVLQKLSGDKVFENLKNFIEKFDEVLKSAENIGNAKGIGEFLNAILNFAQFNGEINMKNMENILMLVEPGGVMSNILTSVHKLGEKAISKDTIQALSSLRSFVELLKNITDIGFRDKIRIWTNIVFFNYYVNKAIPNLIDNIENSFNEHILIDREETLNNLSKYFDALKDVASLSFKEKLNIITSLSFFQDYLVKKLANFVKNTNEAFKGIEIDEGFGNVVNFFKNLSNLVIPSKFDEQQAALSKVEEFLFGNRFAGRNGNKAEKFIGNIARKFDNITGKSSILGIINRLKNEQTDFTGVEDTTKIIKDSFANLKSAIMSLNISEKDIESKTRVLEIFSDDFLAAIISINEYGLINKKIFKKTNKKQDIENGIATLKLFEEKISNISSLNDALSKIDISNRDIIKKSQVLEIFSTIFLYEIRKLKDEKQNIIDGLSALQEFKTKITNNFENENISSVINKIIPEADANKKLLVLKKFIENFSDISQSINKNNDKITNSITAITNLITKFKEIKIDTTLEKELNKIIVSNDIVEKLDNTKKVIKKLSQLYLLFIIIEKFSITDKSINNLEKLGEGLDKIFTAINKLNPEAIKNASNLLNEIFKFIIGTAIILVTGSFLMAQIDWQGTLQFTLGMLALVICVGGLIWCINKFKLTKEEIYNAANIFKEINKLFIVSSIVLIIGSMIMQNVKFKSLGMYLSSLAMVTLLTAKLISIIDNTNLTKEKVLNAVKLFVAISALMLASSISLATIIKVSNNLSWKTLLGIGLFFTLTIAYVFGIVYLIKYLNKYNVDASKNVKSLMQLSVMVLLLSASLSLVALASQVASWDQILAFGGSIALMIAAVTLPLKFINSPMFKIAQKSGIELGSLILLISGALMLGAYIVQSVPIKVVFAFGATLSLMIVSLTLPLIALSITGKAAMKGGKDLGTLILYVTFGLGLGALFMMIPGMKEKIKEFADVYNSFLFSFLISVGLCSLLSKHGFKDIKEVVKIVKISTIVLLLGGSLFLMFNGLKGAVIDYATTLGLFIIGITLAVGIAAMIGNKGIKNMWQVSLLVAISGAVLITAALLMKEDPNMTKNIFGFTLAVLLLVGGFVLIAKFADIKKLWRGLLSIGIITLIILGITYVFSQMKELLAYNIGQLWALTASMLGIITMFLLGAGVIGSIALGAFPFLLIGGAVMMLAGLLVWGIGWTLSKVLEIDKEYNLYENKDKLNTIIDVLFDSVDHILTRIYNLKTSDSGFTSLIKKIPLVGGAIGTAVDSLTLFPNLAVAAAGILATTVIAYNLSKLIFYMKLCGENPIAKIDKAANLIEAVLGIYNKKEILEQIETAEKRKDLINGMVKMSEALSDVIYKISLAIKNYAELKIEEIGPDGKPTGKFRPLKTEDFAEAAKNIATVITCVGGSIMGLFNIGPFASKMTEDQKAVAMEMLKVESGGLFRSNKTKFGMVVEAAEGLGKVIEKIAEGAIKWNELPPNFDTTKASNNIQTIITTIGGAIIKLYNGEGLDNITKETANEMFKTDNIFTGNNKFKRVSEAVGKLGVMISNIMEGVQSYANLKIPTKFNKEGKPTNWRPMTPVDFYMAQFNIGKLVTTLGEALIKVGDSELFKNIYGGQNIKNISEALVNVSQIISPIAESIWMYATGKFPKLAYKGGKLTTIDWYDAVTEGGGVDKVAEKAAKNIGIIITSLATKIGELLKDKNVKLMYNDADKVRTLTISLINISSGINKAFVKMQSMVKQNLKQDVIQNSISDPFNEFIKNFIPDSNLDNKAKLYARIEDGSLDNYIKALESMSNVMLNIFNDLNEIIKLAEAIQPKMALTNSLYNNYIKLYNTISTFALTSYKTEIGEVMKQYNTDLQEVINLINQVDENKETQFNVLKEGISGLAAVVAGIKNNKNFTDHVNNVKKYVESTNKLDLVKIRSLTNLVNAITDFGKSFGNIDEFTNKVVEKLTEALSNLATKLDEAKGTIETADNLHSKREKLIKKSIENITELMKNELTVNIKGENSENQLGNTTQTPIDTGKKESTSPLFDSGSSASTPWQPESNAKQIEQPSKETEKISPYVTGKQIQKETQVTNNTVDIEALAWRIGGIITNAMQNNE